MYLGVSIVLLYPVLAAPVMADDLFNPYGQFDVAGPGFAAAVDFGWDGSTQGGSFRILGTVTGAVYNWLWLSSAAWLGLDPAVFFAVTKYFVLVLCAAAVGWCWGGLSEYCGRSIRFRTAFVWVSFMLFSTVQIHAMWSNDPVASYPLAGYGAAALGFVLIGAAARLARRRSPLGIALTALVALAGVLYYELNIGAVLASFGLLAVAWWQARRGRRSGAGSIAVAGFVIAGLPAASVLFGRTVTGEQSTSYAGTTIRLSGAVSTFARGAITSLPGTAWHRSIDALGGRLGVVFFVFGTVALCLCAGWWWLTSGDDAEPTESTEPTLMSLLSVVSCVLAVAVSAAFALALQSVTIKVQDEAPGVGYVYTWYAMTSSAVALGLAVVARMLWVRRGGTAARLALAVGVSVLFVQSTVNWRLTEQLVVDYGINLRLIGAFDDEVPAVQRCAALLRWQETAWPEYYEQGLTDGISEAFHFYFDEPFCPLVETEG